MAMLKNSTVHYIIHIEFQKMLFLGKLQMSNNTFRRDRPKFKNRIRGTA